MKRLLFIFCLFITCFAYGQTYHPTAHIQANDAIGYVQRTPADARTMFYDSILILYRPFQSVNEVYSYFPNANNRFGNAIIVVDSGGTLQSNGKFLNGHNTFYMWADTTSNAGLVKMSLFGSNACSACLLIANNLSDLNNVVAARSNLGLGAMALLGTTAGGDLNGTYPNPTVAKFNGQLPAYYLDYTHLTNTPTIPAQFNPIQGSGITITGSYPNMTFSVTGGGGGITQLFAEGGGVNILGPDTVNADTTALLQTKYLPSGEVFGGNASYSSVPSFLFPNQAPIDTIYAPKYFTVSDYKVTGSATLSSGGIVAGGTSGVYTNFFTVGFPMNYLYWHFTQGVKIVSETSNSGIEIGTHSINGPNPFDVGVNVPLTTAGSTPIYANSLGSNQLFATSGTNLSYSVGDSIQIDVDFSQNVLTCTAKNITTSGPLVTVSYTWTQPIPGGAGAFYPNSSYFTVYALGGSQKISAPVITSSWIKNPTVLMLMDSRGEYAGANWISGPGDSLNINYPSTLTWCDEGSGTTQFLGSQQSIFALNPKTVVFFVGSNGIRAGLSNAQEEFNDDSLMTVLGQRGFRTFLCVIPEDSLKSGVGMTAIKNRDSIVYSATGQYIDIWNPLTNGTNILAPAYEYTDGIHWIAAGQSLVYRTILNSGKLLAIPNRVNFLQHNGLYTFLRGNQLDLDTSGVHQWLTTLGLGGQTLDQTLALGNTSSHQLFLTGYNSTGPNTEISDYVIQNFALNNGFFNDNVFFNGTSPVYKNSGYGSGVQFFNGQVLLHAEASGTSGATASVVYPFKADNLGEVALGGNINSNLGNYTGATVLATASDVSIRNTSGTTIGDFDINNSAFYLNSYSSSPSIARGILSAQFTNDSAAAEFLGRKARIVSSVLSPLVNTDIISGYQPQPYDGSSYLTPATLMWVVNGAVSTGVVPTDLVVATGSGATVNGTERFRITSSGLFQIPSASFATGAITDSVVVENTSAGVMTLKKVAQPISGSYTPTLTGTTNITSPTLSAAYYTRVGDIVHVTISGGCVVTSSATQSVLTFSLPIARSVNTVISPIGHGVVAPNSGGSSIYVGGHVALNNDTTTGNFNFYYVGIAATGDNFSFSFDYSL